MKRYITFLMALFSVFAGLDAASVRLVRTEGGTTTGWNGNDQTGTYLYHSVVIPAGKVMVINSTTLFYTRTAPTYYLFYNTQDPDIILTNGFNDPSSIPECVGVTPASDFRGEKVYVPGPSVFLILASYLSNVLLDIEYQFISDRDAGPDVTVPSNAVVIPRNNSGNVQVIMECSEDLVTWTACEPGSWGPGNNGKFFRVRVEKENP